MPRAIAQDRIAETEAALGTRLPAVYKMYMGRSNGGSVRVDGETWELFPIRDSTSRETLRRTAEDLCRETQRAIEADLGFPADGIAIAHNGSGDLLFLRRDQPAVWIYRLYEGELAVVLDDVGELWER